MARRGTVDRAVASDNRGPKFESIMYDHYTSSLWILLIREINNWRHLDVDELALSAHNNIRHKVNLEFQ